MIFSRRFTLNQLCIVGRHHFFIFDLLMLMCTLTDVFSYYGWIGLCSGGWSSALNHLTLPVLIQGKKLWLFVLLPQNALNYFLTYKIYSPHILNILNPVSKLLFLHFSFSGHITTTCWAAEQCETTGGKVHQIPGMLVHLWVCGECKWNYYTFCM